MVWDFWEVRGKMAEAEEFQALGEGIHISEEVVRIIAGMAASEVEGVASLAGGIVGEIAERLGRKDVTRGVKAQIGEREAKLDVFLTVYYGVRIPEVAQVEEMTGLEVTEVNVHVQGVEFARSREESR
jgi:uncharacterized alkaline shock family protein YloU